IQDGDANLEVTFYLDEEQAHGGLSEDQLTSPHTSGSTTIYVRIVEEGYECAAIVPLDLVVNPLPILPESVFLPEQCAIDGADNVFDLSDSDLHAEILSQVEDAVSNYDIFFFETESAAQNADVDQSLDETQPYEVEETTVIWARVVNTETGCESIVP